MTQQQADFIRVESGDAGTFDAVLLDGHVFCVALEPEIPIQEGQYIAGKYMSPKFGYEVWKLDNTPGYTYVEIHPGNMKENTTACLLLGQYWGKLNQHRAILNSGETFRMFMAATEQADTLLVTVRSAIQPL